VTVLPAASNVCVSGEIENVHAGGAAACVTVKIWPAIVAVPVLASPGFAANDSATLPLPVPPPEAIAIHSGAFDADVHEHVGADAVTVTVALPASGPMLALVGAMLKVHGGGGAAAWSTVKVLPATVTVPLRAPPVLAAMLTVTLPLPTPLAPLAIVSHGAFDVAVHEQFAVTVIVAVAASGPTLADGGAIAKLQVGAAAAWFTVNV
jgi:hypothetical protein